MGMYPKETVTYSDKGESAHPSSRGLLRKVGKAGSTERALSLTRGTAVLGVPSVRPSDLPFVLRPLHTPSAQHCPAPSLLPRAPSQDACWPAWVSISGPFWHSLPPTPRSSACPVSRYFTCFLALPCPLDRGLHSDGPVSPEVGQAANHPDSQLPRRRTGTAWTDGHQLKGAPWLVQGGTVCKRNVCPVEPSQCQLPGPSPHTWSPDLGPECCSHQTDR